MMCGVSEDRVNQVSGGVFLIGLALLFLTPIPFFPGILFVIAASTLAQGMAEGRAWYSVSGAMWMFGLGIMFLVGWNFWPVMLILVGAGMLLGWNMRPDHDNAEADFDDWDEKPKNKPKRGGDGLEYYDEEDDIL